MQLKHEHGGVPMRFLLDLFDFEVVVLVLLASLVQGFEFIGRENQGAGFLQLRLCA